MSASANLQAICLLFRSPQGLPSGGIGCFLTGLSDKTYGTPTNLPWGVDFGDGVRRHPTQLYEAVFLIGLAAVLYRLLPIRDAACRTSTREIFDSSLHSGDVFKFFMISYLGFRFVLDFWKPSDPAVLSGNGFAAAGVAGRRCSGCPADVGAPTQSNPAGGGCMRVFATLICILGCILFTLMSACFGLCRNVEYA